MFPEDPDEADQEPDQERVLCQECGEPTRRRKPYCTAHVELMPYAADLIERMWGRAREIAQPRADGGVAEEVLSILRHDVVTLAPKGLAKRLEMQEAQAAAWLDLLVSEGLLCQRGKGRVAAAAGSA